MLGRADVRDVVDRMLAADKILAGESGWKALQGDKRALRWRKPCIIGGEVTEMEMEVIAYPDEGDSKFRIVLLYQKAVCRLDHVRNEAHNNSLNRPEHLPPGPINEYHYHSWLDNRRFATAMALPSFLKNANVLPGKIEGFDTAFRWFCGVTNITVPSLDMPLLPNRTTLL